MRQRRLTMPAAETSARDLLKRRWDALLDVSPDLVFWLTPDGTYLDFHTTSPEYLVVRPGDIIGRNVRDVMPPEQAAMALDHLAEAISTGQVRRYQYSYEFAGGIRHFESRLLASGGEVVALVRDISAQVQLVSERNRNARYYQALLEDAFDVIAVTDANGVITFITQAARALFGFDAAEVVGTSIGDWIHPDDMAFALRRMQELTERAVGEGPTELRVRHAQGGWRTCEIVAANLLDDPAVGALVFHLRDITVRVSAQHRLQMLFQTHPMASAYIYPTGMGLIANLAFANLFGFDGPGEQPDIRPLDLVAPDDRARVAKALVYGWDESEPNYREVRFRRIDGSEFPATVWAAPAADDDPNGLLIAIDDHSAEHEALQALQAQERELAETRLKLDRAELEARLRQSQRLESIGRLAAGVAHDFTNLVGVALNYISVLERSDLDATQRDDLAQIQRSAQVAAELAQRLLHFGRAGESRSEPFDLAEAVHSMRDVIRSAVGRHADTTVIVPDGAVVVEADRAQIEQVVLNLAMNARDAIDARGSIAIELDTLHAPDERLHARLAVRDNGCGMNDHTLQRAFDPFFTTKSHGMGTGLGLSVVDGIVAHAGGRVEIDSREGAGTTVTVLLPISRVQP